MAVGISLLVFAQAWRGIETILSARSIELFTGQITQAVPVDHRLIIYENNSVVTIFHLSSDCSVAYLLAALFLGAAPLMLLRQLSPWRTGIAIGITATILMLVNVGRVTAIAATVKGFGFDSGLTIAHTYLGSFLTLTGTCVAGLVFAAVLVGRRRSGRRAMS